MEFGRVFVGARLIRSLRIVNEGNEDLIVASIESDVPEVSLSQDSLTLVPGESAALLLTYAPTVQEQLRGLGYIE